MIQPPFIKSGDKIGIVAPAGKVPPGTFEKAREFFSEWQLVPLTGIHSEKRWFNFSGTDEERLSDLQQMLDDRSVKAIIFARGGYGSVRIIDRIDFSRFAENPKWIAGFSDATVLHSHIHANFGIQTLHSAMPVQFPGDATENEAMETLIRALMGKRLAYRFTADGFCRKGKAEAVVTGGNLSIIYSLAGTVSEEDMTGKILFLEDVGEYHYHIDRMMIALKRRGILAGLAGLIVGHFNDLRDEPASFGMSAREIIREQVDDYSYPVFFGFPAGHVPDNRALILGRKARFKVTDHFALDYL